MTDRDASAGEPDGEGGEGDGDEREEVSGDADHLTDVEDGAGCTEVWERLSERREE